VILMTPADRLADELLSKLLDYLTARRAFEIAVDKARRLGWPDEEIYRVTGMSPQKVEAALGHRQDVGQHEAPSLNGSVAA
jgi:hypothetical protein